MTQLDPVATSLPRSKKSSPLPTEKRTRGRDQKRWEASEWRPVIAKFLRPCPWRANWQAVSTLSLYVATWVALFFTAEISLWLTVPLVLLGGGLLVRVFIIFHDATHGSFYKSRTANEVIGGILGVLTFTPFKHWRGEHNVHHSTTGDLDRRGVGDIWTMTVREYLSSSKWRKLCYRVARNPIALFVIAPFVLFVVIHRFSRRGAPVDQRRSVLHTNLALIGLTCVMGSIFGFGTYIVLQLAIMGCAGAIGIWLFYMQHQFEDVYWEHHRDWDYTVAALEGSSFLRLPRILQWFSGNIGFHHIHHLSPRIPNYHLERCHYSHKMFSEVPVMTFWSSFASLRLRLWDETSRRLVSWSELRQMRRALAR